MDRLINNHNEIGKRFADQPNIQHIHINKESAPKENPAHKLLKPDTNEYYRVSMFQQTVVPLCDQLKYTDILNEYGLSKFQEAQQRYERNDVKGEFVYYTKQTSQSGSWFKDPTSRFNTPAEDNFGGVLNSWNNIVISGVFFPIDQSKPIDDSELIPLTTSVCIFITDDWCLTHSNNIYKLQKQVSMLEMMNLQHK